MHFIDSTINGRKHRYIYILNHKIIEKINIKRNIPLDIIQEEQRKRKTKNKIFVSIWLSDTNVCNFRYNSICTSITE